MPKRTISTRTGHPFLDIISHPRGGPGQQVHFSRAQIEQITRTVRHTPEVVIKVLPKDSNSARSIRGHINYIGRKGKLDIETDDGRRLGGKDAGKQLLDDWDLDLESTHRETEFSKARGRRASKLVHKLVFSMPPGTPPKDVLAAVRNFALEKFALQHRYAMVLHTDEPHPHVHVVVKAVSEQGVRLNISKETLREWRSRFAHYLREEGIAANATDRFMRGRKRIGSIDGMYRAAIRDRAAHEHSHGNRVSADALRNHQERASAMQVHHAARRPWKALADALRAQGHDNLAHEVNTFVPAIRSPSKRELVKALLEQREHRRSRYQHHVR